MTPSAPGREERAADPDSRARTHLANERTFLAWLRTGMTLVALGVAAAQFLTQPATGATVIPVFSTLIISMGVVLVATGLWRYLRGLGRIPAETFMPARASVIATSIIGLAAGMLAIAVVWLLPHR